MAKMELDLLKNEISKIKKVKNDNNNIVNYEVDFNFSNNEEINNFLIEKSRELLGVMGNSNLRLGKIFEDVKEFLSENEKKEIVEEEKNKGEEKDDLTYCNWLAFNGFDRMKALRCRNRYNLFKVLKNEESKRLIAIFPQRIIDDFSKIIKNDELKIKDIDNIKNIQEAENLIGIFIENKEEKLEVEEESKQSKKIDSLFKNISKDIEKNNIKKAKSEISKMKKMILEMEKNIKIQEEKNMNENNLKIFD